MLIYMLGQIQTGQTGGQPYSDTSPYEVSLYSLAGLARLRVMFLVIHEFLLCSDSSFFDRIYMLSKIALTRARFTQ